MKIQDGIEKLKAIGEQVSARFAGKSKLGVVAAVGVGIGAIASAVLLFARKGGIKARIGELAAKLTSDASDKQTGEHKPHRLNSHERRQRAPAPEPVAT